MKQVAWCFREERSTWKRENVLRHQPMDDSNIKGLEDHLQENLCVPETQMLKIQIKC